MHSTLFAIRCGQCGREPPAIFRCRERKTGACPYFKRWSKRLWQPIAVLAFFGFWLASCTQRWWLLLAGLALGLLWALLVVEEQWQNKGNSVVLRRTTLLGVDIGLTSRVRLGDVPFSAEPAHPARYPLSVLTLAGRREQGSDEEELAASILRAALVDLHTKHLIDLHMLHCRAEQVMRVHTRITIDYYVTRCTRHLADDLDLGDTESHLLSAFTSWFSSGPLDHDWPDGPTIYELIRAYYENDRGNPAKDVVKSVEKNAEQYDLCTMTNHGSWWKPKEAVWGGKHAAELQFECQAAKELLDSWARANPDAWTVLHEEAVRAIKSRIDSGD